MSLAVLARKTKTKMRSKSTKCGGITNGSRTKGHILNMTNRGGGIGLSGMSYKYRGSGCRSGAAETCCSANKTVSAKCRKGCSCRFGGLSQPAPQMSYRTYLNRKSNGQTTGPCAPNTTVCQAIGRKGFDYAMRLPVADAMGQGCWDKWEDHPSDNPGKPFAININFDNI